MTVVLTVHKCTYVPPTSDRNLLDGDTFRCVGDASPIVPDASTWIPKVRVVRINAPETSTNQPGSQEARTRLIHWLELGPFDLLCVARDKYGRLLGDARAPSGNLLSQYMLDNHLANPMKLDHAKELVPGAPNEVLRSIVLPGHIT